MSQYLIELLSLGQTKKEFPYLYHQIVLIFRSKFAIRSKKSKNEINYYDAHWQ